jgi:hypothetical protein
MATGSLGLGGLEAYTAIIPLALLLGRRGGSRSILGIHVWIQMNTTAVTEFGLEGAGSARLEETSADAVRHCFNVDIDDMEEFKLASISTAEQSNGMTVTCSLPRAIEAEFLLRNISAL